MKNITLAIDDDLLAAARRRAEEMGTTVNAVVRDSLRRFTQGERSAYEEQAQARAELLELMRNSNLDLGPDYKWNREELYDRASLRGYEHPGLRGDGQD